MKFVILLFSLVLVACGVSGKDADGTIAKAKAEEQATMEVQNKNMATKSERMEADLASRHAYYQAIAGKYEGDLTTSEGIYKIRISVIPSVLPYKGNRVRELSEIENDLNNLFFYFEIKQWHPEYPKSAVSCKVAGIKPNVDTGYLVIASPDCANLYQVYLSENFANAQNPSTVGENGEIAKKVSSQIRTGEISRVTRIAGSLQPSTNAENFSFDAIRTE
jgi:hypothetical protein